MRRKAITFLLSLSVFFLGGFASWLYDSANQAFSAETVKDLKRPFPHESSDLKPDPSATFGSLPNGLRYIIYRNTEPKGRAFLYLHIAAGSSYETDDQRGIAHFLEHMAFNGSDNFKPGTLVKSFQNLGMSFGRDINAFTSMDQTAYSLDLPNTKNETLEKGMLVLADYARRLTLLQEEIDRERGVILAEMGDRDSVGWRIYKARTRFVYDNVHLANRMPIGTEQTVKAMDKPLFDDFYQTWYRPERMTLVVVGDIDQDTLLPMMKREFAPLTAAGLPRPRPGLGEYNHDGIKAFTYANDEASNTVVEILTATREDAPADSVAQRREETARDLGESILIRRFQKLSKQEGATFVSGSGYSYHAYNWSRHAGVRLTGKEQNWKAMLTLAERELRRALTHGFTKTEIKEAKARMMQSLEQAVLKADTRDSRRLAGQLISSINSDRVFLSPADNRDLLKDYINGLTDEMILDAFRKAWKADHRLVMVTGNAKLTDKEILDTYAKSTAVDASPPKETELIPFAYNKAPAKAGTIKTRKTFDDLGIEQIDFEDGLRLNLRKTDFKKNEILIRLRFGTGVSTLPLDMDGLPLLTNIILNEGGLGKHSKEELKSILAGHTAHVGLDVANDHMSISGFTMPKDVELTLQLIRAYYTDPGYRPEALRLARKHYADSYKGMERTLGGVYKLEVERFITDGDIRFGSPSLETFNKRTVDEVRAWVNAQREATPLEISIVGDFDQDKVVKLVGRYFGAMKSNAPSEKEIRPAHLVKPIQKNFDVPTKIDRGQLTFYWKTTDAFTDMHRTRRLSILGKVFDEFLRIEVREKIGGAYSPYSYSAMSDTYPDYGYLMALVKIDPNARDTIQKAIIDIAAKLHADGIDEEMFNRIMLPTRSGIKKYRRSNQYWMTVINGSLSQPEQLDWAKSFVRDYEAMTVEEINTLAKIYLDPAKAVIINLRPEK